MKKLTKLQNIASNLIIICMVISVIVLTVKLVSWCFGC